jgi:hypothetical protein
METEIVATALEILFERSYAIQSYRSRPAASARYFRSSSYITTPPAVATFSECFAPSIGMRTCVSQRADTSGRIPSTSCPNTTQTGNCGVQSNRSTACTDVSIAAISHPRARIAYSSGSGSHANSHGTVSSAPSAVLVIARFGGCPVMPHRYSFSMAAASHVRKNAPTLYRLRTLSNRIETGNCAKRSYAAPACVA